jgi:hypothetical protein
MLGTASGGDPAVFSLLSPLAAPLLLEPRRKAGADPEAISGWIEEGRRRRANAGRLPFSNPNHRRPGHPLDHPNQSPGAPGMA